MEGKKKREKKTQNQQKNVETSSRTNEIESNENLNWNERKQNEINATKHTKIQVNRKRETVGERTRERKMKERE